MKNLPLMLKTIGLIAVVAVLASAGQAQNREKFGISARAGGVNSVSGSAMVTRTGQAPQSLTNQDDLSAGDAVTTGPASQVEVLLNPGSYLRMAANSEFILVDNSLDNLVVRLVKGSAIIEVTGGDDTDMWINVLANQKRLVITRSGIYRVNVQPGTTELLVRQGRVLPDNDPRELVKGGKKVTYGAGDSVIAKLDKKDQDDFDAWSKLRAKTLAQANLKISNRSVNGYLSSMSDFEMFSAANSWGLWAYSSFARSYTFVPFRYGWASPYGHYYGNYCNVWRYPGGSGYNGAGSGTIVSYPGSGGAATGAGGSSAGGSTGGSRAVTPSGPAATMGSQAGPRDPDSGSRSINRIKEPN